MRGKTKSEWIQEIDDLLASPRTTKGDKKYLERIKDRLIKVGIMPTRFAMTIGRIKEDMVPGRTLRQDKTTQFQILREQRRIPRSPA